MIIWEPFKIRINISRDYYEKKSDAIACLSREGAKAIGKEKMAFDEHNVTVSEFLNYALTGHTFCNLFSYDPNQQYWIQTSTGKYQSYPIYRNGSNVGGMKLSFKSDDFFIGSQAIFVDVDNTRFTDVGDYINTLRYPPTCVYMSYSDGIQKHGVVSRRFRMVYVMDHVLDRNEFASVSSAINDQIVMDTGEPMEDDCGTRMSQYMNGVFGNSEVYCTNIIYSSDDFPAPVFDCSSTEELSTNTTIPDVVFNDWMVRSMVTLDYAHFMHTHSTQYRYVYRTEQPDWPYLFYQLTDENYLQLWYYTRKQVDGEKRRKKLFQNACLRRLMYPDIDADTLLFNLYVDRERFFDNSDGVITIETLMRNVNNAMKMTWEQLVNKCEWEINYWDTHRPTFIFKTGIKSTIGLNNSILKTIRWRNIEIGYDRLKSVQENAQLLNVSQSTLYRFCDEQNIDTNPQKMPTEAQKRAARKQSKQEKINTFKKLFDSNLTVRENQKLLALWGLELSVGTIQDWRGRYL